MHEVESSEREFVITRIIDAPRSLVFKAWTDPNHMARWWGPHTFTTLVHELDARPGGAYHFVMRSREGVDYPLRGVYREVVEPERLVFTDDWSEHPAEWHDMLNNLHQGLGKPDQGAITTVTFDEQAGKTLLTIRMTFESAATRDAMVKMGMNEGWSQSLERLAEVVAAV